jgi:2-C-methyl-D-erythritol 2,4-cyclodiphosphate synthase
MFRVGFGQDSHRFSDDLEKKLVLGGVTVSKERGLEGNSDADVVIHSICRALEQAIGGESFSIYADKMNAEGISDSREYLKVSAANVERSGYRIGNLGISLECKKPKIVPLVDDIKAELSAILKIGEDQIGVSATSGEGLTAFGRGEGIQCFAIVSLIKNEKD